MEVTIREDGKNIYIAVSGNIDEDCARELKSKFSSLKNKECNEAILDFSGVERIGSAGIGQVLMLYKSIAINGGVFRIEKVSDHVYEVFRLTKLIDIFTVTKG